MRLEKNHKSSGRADKVQGAPIKAMGATGRTSVSHQPFKDIAVACRPCTAQGSSGKGSAPGSVNEALQKQVKLEEEEEEDEEEEEEEDITLLKYDSYYRDKGESKQKEELGIEEERSGREKNRAETLTKRPEPKDLLSQKWMSHK